MDLAYGARRGLLLLVLAAMLVGCGEPPATEPVARGRQVYRQLECSRCHQISGSGSRIGPDLTRVATEAERRQPGRGPREYLREAVLRPGSYVVPGYADVMPRGLADRLDVRDLDALIEYLASLRR